MSDTEKPRVSDAEMLARFQNSKKRPPCSDTLGMSLAEVLTCVREEIPAVAVVFNNGQWGAEKKNQIDYYDDRYIGTNLDNPSFAGIAKAMGADGITVSSPSEVGDALRAAATSSRCTESARARRLRANAPEDALQ